MNNKISIIGVGRLGICTALVLEEAGYDVVGVDIFPSYVDAINNKVLKSSEPGVEDGLKVCKNFRATLSLDEALQHSDIIFVLVATPTGPGKKSYDHSQLSNVLSKINDRAVENKHIVIGCTVLPGYIQNIGRELLSDCKNTTLSYNPEFIAQGNIMHGFRNPDMVLIGQETDEIGLILEQMYLKCCHNSPKIHRMSAESAEITKLAVNCFITTKIAYANTIADIAERTDNASATDILSAVGDDTRVGQKCLLPGFGFGGPCFPRDNRALGNYADSIGVDPIIPRATDSSNNLHAELMAQSINNSFSNDYVATDVAYKPKCPVPIIEESQPLRVAEIMAKKYGKNVTIQDRPDILNAVKKEYGNMFLYKKL